MVVYAYTSKQTTECTIQQVNWLTLLKSWVQDTEGNLKKKTSVLHHFSGMWLDYEFCVLS